MRSKSLVNIDLNLQPGSKFDSHRLVMRKHSHIIWLVALTTLTSLVLIACGNQPPESRVFFAEPQNGAQVKSPFRVIMGSEGVVIEPASENGNYKDGHGHHHIVIDAPVPSLRQPIPKNSIHHLHYGKGQSETVLDLDPGDHTLRLLFAKGDHVPWDPEIADAIQITVVD